MQNIRNSSSTGGFGYEPTWEEYENDNGFEDDGITESTSFF